MWFFSGLDFRRLFFVFVESMWQLGLTGGESYPERPGVPNCVYYMRTGCCGYGGRCRYNHPRDRAAVLILSYSLIMPLRGD